MPSIGTSTRTTPFEGTGLPITLTYDPTYNSIPSVTSLKLKYPDISGQVVNPTIVGVVDDDNPEGVLVEISLDDSFSTIDGVAIADESGQFEFTPLGLNYDTQYTFYARAMEWDVRQSAGNEKLVQDGTPTQLADDSGAPLTFTLVEHSLESDPFVSFELAYDTGASSSDFMTGDPTVRGKVDYDGDMADVTVEFEFIPTAGAKIVGETTPDEDGLFEYTPEGLPEGDFNVVARVVVPNYGVRAPEFENTLLESDGGVLDASWYTDGYNFTTQMWNDADGDGQVDEGTPDVNTAWLDSLFAEDGVTFSGEQDWYSSGFSRDWDSVLADLTSSWQMIDNLPVESSLKLDSAQNNAPGFDDPLTVPTGNQLAATISGTLLDDGRTDGVVLEFFVVGKTTPDGSAVTDETGYFSYTFKEPLIDQTTTFQIDVLEPQYEADPLRRSNVASGTFNVVSRADLVITELSLANPTDTVNLAAIDPTLTGTISSRGDVAFQMVEFDYDDDGLADASTTTDNMGEFEFTALGVGTGNVSVRARLVEAVTNDLSRLEYGAWSSDLAWNALPNSAPTWLSYALAYDTGHSGLAYDVLDLVTSDATLVGRVTDDNSAAAVTVEFDHDGNGIADGSVVTDADGYFRYEPQGLSLGRWDIQARAIDAIDDTLNSGWKPLTETGNPETTYLPYTGLILVAPTAATVSLTAPASSTDPTITGTVSDEDTPANVTVDFYLGSVAEENYLGSTQTDSNGNFSFTPVGLEFNKSYSICAVPRELDYLSGDELLGTSPNSVSVTLSMTEAFSLSAITRETTDSLVDVTLSGTFIAPPADTVPAYVEVGQFEYNDVTCQYDLKSGTVTRVGVEAIYDTVTLQLTGYEYSYRPQLSSSDTPYYFKARPVGLVTNEGLVYGNWTELKEVDYNLQLPSIPEEDVEDDQSTVLFTGWALLGANSEWETLTPELSGFVIQPGGTTPVAASEAEVEFDLDGDGTVDEVAYADATGYFSHEFTNLEPGTIAGRARAVRYHTYDDAGITQYERIEGDWQALDFMLLDPAPVVTSPQLKNPTVTGGTESTDPTFEGTVTSPLGTNVTGMTVEVDLDGDGVVDATTIVVNNDSTVPAEGTFEVTLSDLQRSDTPQTIYFRAVDVYSDPQTLTGEWLPVTFTLLLLDAPTVDSLSLLLNEDLDGGGSVSSDPIITGTTTVPDGASQVRIEFDHKLAGGDYDGLIDGSASVDIYGGFTYSAGDLPHGDLEVRARVSALVGTETYIGAWSDTYDTAVTLFFTHKVVVPAVVTQFRIEDEAQGVVSGRVTIDGYGASVQVEIAAGTGPSTTTNGYVQADSDGYFEYELKRLYAESDEDGTSYTVQARGIVLDPQLRQQC